MDLTTTEFTPVTPRAGGLVHAYRLVDSRKTACNRNVSGWRITHEVLNCQACRKIVHVDVRTPDEKTR